MAITRRAALKAFAAGSVGAVFGGGAYGFLYERRAIEITRAEGIS